MVTRIEIQSRVSSFLPQHASNRQFLRRRSGLPEPAGYQDEVTQETGNRELRREEFFKGFKSQRNAGLLQVAAELLDTMVRFWNNHESMNGTGQLYSPGQR
jgi:hypothetical protein